MCRDGDMYIDVYILVDDDSAGASGSNYASIPVE